MESTLGDEFEIIDTPIINSATSPPKTLDFASKPGSPEFRALLSILQNNFNSRAQGPIFHARLNLSSTLFEYYLAHLPDDVRKRYTCTTCRRFVDQVGGLCQVQGDGTLRPLIWPHNVGEIPKIFQGAISALNQLFVGKAVGKEYRVLTKEIYLGGEPKKDGWIHFHFPLEGGSIPDPGQALDSDTAYAMLARTLEDYDLNTILRAHHLLHDKLPHATTHTPAINWLKHVAEELAGKFVDNASRRNLITRYAHTAWVGCLSSLRGGIIGTLLDNVAAGLDYSEIESRWTALANPLTYLRPEAAPSEGNILSAEKTFAALGYTKEDLLRYYMTEDQVPKNAILWEDPSLWNRPPPESGDKIFSSLKEKVKAKVAKVDNNPTTMSFRTFARTILPTAKSIEILVPSARVLGFFTSGGPGSKSPFVFGSETNTGSHYRWGNARPVREGGISEGWTSVTAITSLPHMWEYISPMDAIDFEAPRKHDTKAEEQVKIVWPHSRHGPRFLFCLQGAKDQFMSGLGLFPSLMRGEFHGVRKTVEAFNKSREVGQPINGEGKHVGGIINSKGEWDLFKLRVEMENGVITRFELPLFD